MNNPILIEVTRGKCVESVHRGALAVVDAAGAVNLQLGDVKTPVYPRSAIKAWQCLPLIESGAADRFGFGDKQVALACGSHTAAPEHLRVVEEMLEAICLDPSALGCGAHVPLGGYEAQALFRAGNEPTALHNNCSGKHVGMLATALHMGWPTDGYWCAEHPVQVRVREAVSEIADVQFADDSYGIDGCSLPNWAIALQNLAAGMARLTTGEGLSGDRAAAVRRIVEACWAQPDMVAGERRLDSVVMKALRKRVFVKTGAEGVYAGALAEPGLGFALKIDDGAKRAAEAVVMALIGAYIHTAADVYPPRPIRSWNGREVGEIRLAGPLCDVFGCRSD